MNFCGLWMTHLGEREKPAPVPLTGVGVHVRIVDLVVRGRGEDRPNAKYTRIIARLNPSRSPTNFGSPKVY